MMYYTENIADGTYYNNIIKLSITLLRTKINLIKYHNLYNAVVELPIL